MRYVASPLEPDSDIRLGDGRPRDHRREGRQSQWGEESADQEVEGDRISAHGIAVSRDTPVFTEHGQLDEAAGFGGDADAGGLPCCSRRCCECCRTGSVEPVLQMLRRYWSAQVEALRHVTPDICEWVQGLLVFNALCDRDES